MSPRAGTTISLGPEPVSGRITVTDDRPTGDDQDRAAWAHHQMRRRLLDPAEWHIDRIEVTAEATTIHVTHAGQVIGA